MPGPRPPSAAELIAALRAVPVYAFAHARLNFEVSVASGIHTRLVPTSAGVAAAVAAGARLVVVDVAMGQALLALGGLARRTGEHRLGSVVVIVVDHASPELWSTARALGAADVLAVDLDDPEAVAAELVPLLAEHATGLTP